MLVNSKDLVIHLQQESTPMERLYMGKVNANRGVFRSGKFNVSFDEFADSIYPDYCAGAGFVLSYDVVEFLVPVFDVVKPFRIDDAQVMLEYFLSKLASPQFITVASFYLEFIHLMIVIFIYNPHPAPC